MNRYKRNALRKVTMVTIIGIIVTVLYFYNNEKKINNPLLHKNEVYKKKTPAIRNNHCETILSTQKAANMQKGNIISSKNIQLPKKSLPAKTIPQQNISNVDIIKKEKNNEKIIQIKNKITPKMITYKHWSGSYTPDPFVITINGNKINIGGTHTLKITNNKLTIRYDYAFMKGRRKGAKEVIFKVDEKNDLLNITFSWQDKQHILIDNAMVESIHEVPFNASLLVE